jgi:hypothetical protein
MAIGMTIGTACQWFFIRAVRDKAIRAGGKAPPEARLPVGMAGAVLCPIGLLWFALSSLPEMTFFMPMIGIAIFGVGVSSNDSAAMSADNVVGLCLYLRLGFPGSQFPSIRRFRHGWQYPRQMYLGRWIPTVCRSGT